MKMNKHLIILGIAVLLICVGLSGCIGPEQGIWAIKLNEEVDNFDDIIRVEEWEGS